MHIISEIGRWKKSMGREEMERLEKLDNWTEGWEGGRFVKADILDDYRLRTEDQVSMQDTLCSKHRSGMSRKSEIGARFDKSRGTDLS